MDQSQLAPHQQPTHGEQTVSLSDDKPPAKPPVVRGARACTVCRAAKMKCVGADDGNNIPCQRCKRSGLDCIFEKHRRGRKPGSRLSEASKMLRRLEKGLNNAKQKSNNNESLTLPPLVGSSSADGRIRDNGGPSGSHYTGRELPPLNLPVHMQEGYPRSSQPSDSEMDEDDEADQNESGMYPAQVIKRNTSFFKTILNPADEAPLSRPSAASERSYSQHPQSPSYSPPQQSTPVNSLFANPTLKDPVEAGLLSEEEVLQYWDMFYIRLNPFINLFDPALHTYSYVRAKCPFLFTALVMACCKFFKPELYKPVLRLAHEFAVRAFAENWKRVEVVQAFACMTYWREPDDTRTWTYIGYACRMSIELGLNRYVGRRLTGETEMQMRERRNRERTYLVLWVHDRSLSMQTGKHWMLPKDDELVRHITTWHEEGVPIRQEDVIVAAFTQLRDIAAHTTDVFNMHQGGSALNSGDVDYEVLLRDCNFKLNEWVSNWRSEMQRAEGVDFHHSFMMCFQLHVRLFLNTFGIHSNGSRGSTSNIEALSTCYSSAMQCLKIVADDFVRVTMIRYGQDSITVMTAYAAVVLLKLLRSQPALSELKDNATQEIHSMIARTSKAYADAAQLSQQSSSATYHSRFLELLIEHDILKTQQQKAEQERYKCEMPQQNGRVSSNYPLYGHSSLYAQRIHGASGVAGNGVEHLHAHGMNGYYATGTGTPPGSASGSSSSSSSYPPASSSSYAARGEQDFLMADSTQRAQGSYSLAGITTTYAQYQAQPHAEHDDSYWRNMFKDLGIDTTGQPQPQPQPNTQSQGYVGGSGYGAQPGGMGEAGAGAGTALHMPAVAAVAQPPQQQSQQFGGVAYRDASGPAEHGYGGHAPHGAYTSYPVMNSYQAPYGGR